MGFSFADAVMAVLAAFGLKENDAVDAVLKTYHAADGRRRLFIFHRANGTFGFQEEVYDDHILETRWKPAKEKPCPYFATPEDALKAAMTETGWLADHTD